MTSDYEELRKQAKDLEHKLEDKLDDKNHPLASRLTNELRDFTNNVESEKSARTLEDQVKDIIDLLKSVAKDGDTVMDYQDNDFFEERFEDIRRQIKGFDNY